MVNVMRRPRDSRTTTTRALLIAGVALVAACTDGTSTASAPTTPASGSTTGTDSTEPVELPAGVLPFLDVFDDDAHGWGGPFQRFEDGHYVWDLPSGQSDVRSADTLIRVEDEIDDVVVTTTFEAVGVIAVGVQCAFEELEGSSRWYDLELGTNGAVIRRRDLGTTPVETLATNSSITLTDDPTELVVECFNEAGQYLLRLSVDGVPAVEATDPDPFGRVGAPNLSVRAAPTGPDAPEHVVRFDRFEVTDGPPP